MRGKLSLQIPVSTTLYLHTVQPYNNVLYNTEVIIVYFKLQGTHRILSLNHTILSVHTARTITLTQKTQQY